MGVISTIIKNYGKLLISPSLVTNGIKNNNHLSNLFGRVEPIGASNY